MNPLLALFACTGPSGDSGGGEGCERNLFLGTGEGEFVSLEEGDGVVMVHGPQGGWHIFGSAIVQGLGERVAFEFRVVHVDTEVQVAQSNLDLVLDLAQDNCTGGTVGQLLILDVRELEEGELDTPPELLGGDTLRMELDAASIDDRELQLATQQLVTAELDPIDSK